VAGIRLLNMEEPACKQWLTSMIAFGFGIATVFIAYATVEGWNPQVSTLVLALAISYGANGANSLAK
jgi:hypothetical protein